MHVCVYVWFGVQVDYFPSKTLGSKRARKKGTKKYTHTHILVTLFNGESNIRPTKKKKLVCVVRECGFGGEGFFSL